MRAEARRGRPPKPPEEQQSVTFYVRLTPPEADAIYCAALRAKLSANKLLRLVLREAMGRGEFLCAKK